MRMLMHVSVCAHITFRKSVLSLYYTEAAILLMLYYWAPYSRLTKYELPGTYILSSSHFTTIEMVRYRCSLPPIICKTLLERINFPLESICQLETDSELGMWAQV